MINKQRLFRISQLARAANISKRTILFYVDRKLLHPPVKTGKTMAYYDDAHYRKLLFIKNEKKKGLPLTVIRTMIDAREAEGNSFGVSLNKDFIFENIQPAVMRRPKKAPGKITRERIVEEGSRVFQEKGFKNTTINYITRQLKIGKGSFYSYFLNKEELFLECVPLIFDKFFSEGWEKIRKEKDPYRRILLRFEILIPVINEFIPIMQLSREAMKESNLGIKKLGENIYRSMLRPLESDIAKGIAQGIFRAVDPGLCTLMLEILLENIGIIIAMNPNVSIDYVIDVILHFFWNNLLIERR